MYNLFSYKCFPSVLIGGLALQSERLQVFLGLHFSFERLADLNNTVWCGWSRFSL